MQFNVKKLVGISVFVFIAIIAGIYLYRIFSVPDTVFIDTADQPSLGRRDAKVEVVVFEEPKCPHCKHFQDEIFPKIKRNYIDTEEIRYTVIPVSFLSGSLPAANALLCVYYQNRRQPNSQLFFTYLNYIYNHQPPSNTDWASDDTLIDMASQASTNIQLSDLRNCLNKQAYRNQIAINTEKARSIMGGRIHTPAVYINGIHMKENSYANISKWIEKAKIQQ